MQVQTGGKSGQSTPGVPRDIDRLLSSLQEHQILVVYRECNRSADLLAKLGCKLRSTYDMDISMLHGATQ